MNGSKWYPIAPGLTQEGTFAVLAHRSDANDLRPIGDGNGPMQMGELSETTDEINVLAQLGVVGFVSASASANTKVICRDVMIWREEVRKPEEPGAIRGTRWGAGFRLVLSLSDFKGEFVANPAFAAAAIELSLAQGAFELRGYGLADPAVLKHIPVRGRFDQEAYNALTQAETEIRKHLEQAAKDGKLKPQPVQILLRAPLYASMGHARATLLAVHGLAGRYKLKYVQDYAKRSHLDPKVVEEIYRGFISDERFLNETPSWEVRDQARSWLSSAAR